MLRPHRVEAVRRTDADPGSPLLLTAGDLAVAARTVVSATGTWDRPFWPHYPGMREFAGRQLHASDYRTPDQLAGQRVVVVGGGNSAAQVLAEVSVVADTTWVTARPPRFLPDDVDGRVLFARARARLAALAEGRDPGDPGAPGDPGDPGDLGDIVMVASVKQARDRGALRARPMFSRLTATGVAWTDGTEQECDVVVWCTGFRPALGHLRDLGLRTVGGHVRVGGRSGTQALDEPRLFLVGYGDWTGPASATLAGVAPSARATAEAIVSPGPG